MLLASAVLDRTLIRSSESSTPFGRTGRRAEKPGSAGVTSFSGRVRGTIPAMNEADTVTNPLVGVIMGSQSDWETMQHAAETLAAIGVSHECRVVSAHRTPDLLFEYASTAADRGIRVIIAGAGGAAHLPGMVAAKTHLPVLGVPVQSKMLSGMDSLLSIVQMPAGIPVGTLAIGRAGAINAGLLAGSVVAIENTEVRSKLIKWRSAQTDRVLENPIPGLDKNDGAKTS
jgi:5-(carboxyamino)imidazole ribonucleotide mutase